MSICEGAIVMADPINQLPDLGDLNDLISLTYSDLEGLVGGRVVDL